MSKPRNRLVWHPATRATVTMLVVIGTVLGFYLYTEWVSWITTDPLYRLVFVLGPVVIAAWATLYSLFKATKVK